jgi:hypothetical protein
VIKATERLAVTAANISGDSRARRLLQKMNKERFLGYFSFGLTADTELIALCGR